MSLDNKPTSGQNPNYLHIKINRKNFHIQVTFLFYKLMVNIRTAQNKIKYLFQNLVYVAYILIKNSWTSFLDSVLKSVHI